MANEIKHDEDLDALIMVPDEIVATLVSEQVLLKQTLNAAFPKYHFKLGIEPGKKPDSMVLAVKPQEEEAVRLEGQPDVRPEVTNQIISLLDAFCERRRTLKE